MKKLKLILLVLAFVFAIGATLASSASDYLADAAKGINASSMCLQDILDGGRTIGTATGQCFTQNDGNGVCTVTFPGESATTAYTTTGNCPASQVLYIQD